MTRQEELVQAARKEYPEWKEAQCHFIDGAHYADEHPHWISVEDELPPKESEYDDLSNNVLATNGKEIYESVYNHDSKDWFTHDMWGLDNITHWMPMPEAPHHIIDANKKVDRVIGTADHIKTALDVLNKKGDEE